MNFALILFVLVIITGVAWVADKLVFLPQRRRAADAAVAEFDRQQARVGERFADENAPQTRARLRDENLRQPWWLEYSASFFPVILVVFVVRSFVVEPFKIPSGSMVPTLLVGDFILVNKYDYGIRLPITNTKITQGRPLQRGDVVVFRYPIDPSTNFIKRLVGLPGDHVVVQDNRIIINGKEVPFTYDAKYNDGCYENLTQIDEHLGKHDHKAIFCPVALDRQPVLPGCSRGGVRGYVCGDEDAPGFMRTPPFVGDVPPGQYLMMGDNRDNSDDGRSWGFVPEQNLVGKATRIWFNWDPHRAGGPQWHRIGMAIH